MGMQEFIINVYLVVIQDRQCTKNNIGVSSCNHCCSGKEMLHILNVFFSIQCACVILSHVTGPVFTIIFNIIS